MNRRIIFIILGALLLLALIALLWFWLLGREPQTPDSGGFGTGDNRSITGNGDGQTGNGQVGIGSNTSTDNTSTGINTITPLPGIDPLSDLPPLDDLQNLPPSAYTAPGVTWFDGGVLKNFNPTPINQVNNVSISGTPYILNNPPDDPNNGGGLGYAAIFGGAAAGLALCTSGFLTGSVSAAGSTAISTIGSFAYAVQVHDVRQDQLETSNQIRENFLDCITRGIARIAIEKITASTVDWINSGFDGKPAFVQDYQQFFTDVADEAAGEYIRGTKLAFLCSPFQLQVRIAIAQSYAQRRSSDAPSCTLSGVVGNVEEFMEGTFSEGGWGGLLSFTTVPTNNPFGAYMFGQISLGNEIASAQTNVEITPGGFLSKKECKSNGPNGQEVCRTVTPGVLIEDAARKVIGNSVDSLNLADSFDEIIGALVQQLLTRTLYQGFSKLSGSNGYEDTFRNPLDAEAMAAAQQLLTNLQGAVALAQQYATTQQGSISDIQNAQQQLTTLENCWATASSSPSLTSGQRTQAKANAANAAARNASLETRIAQYNNNITDANLAIAKIQQLQTNALSAQSLTDVQTVAAQFTTAQNSGVLITQAEVTSAHQNRTTLQSEMASQNSQTSVELAQCYAFY